MEVLITFIIMLLFFVVGAPIVYSILISGLFYIAVFNHSMSLFILPQRMIYGIDSFPLMAVPFFILAADLMNESGLTIRIFSFAQTLVGHIRGGLAHVNVVASIILSGMSGSAVADAAGLGKIEIEAMKQNNFDADFAAAVTSASCIIGPIIPPSIPAVIYAVTAGVSVGKLLLAGIIPGILMGLGLMFASYIISVKRRYPKEAKASLKNLINSFKFAFAPMLMPIILVGGIVGGVFTATEGAVAASMYSLILAVIFMRKQSKLRNVIGKIYKIFVKAGCTTSIILSILTGASVLSTIILREQLPQNLSQGVLTTFSNPYIVLLILNILFLILGCFMEALSIMVMVIPLLIPLITKIGIDPVQFGVIMIINLMIGLITPPFGVAMYITSDIAGINIKQFTKAIIPYLAILIVVLLLITYIPILTMFIPNLIIK